MVAALPEVDAADVVAGAADRAVDDGDPAVDRREFAEEGPAVTSGKRKKGGKMKDRKTTFFHFAKNPKKTGQKSKDRFDVIISKLDFFMFRGGHVSDKIIHIKNFLFFHAPSFR